MQHIIGACEEMRMAMDGNGNNDAKYTEKSVIETHNTQLCSKCVEAHASEFFALRGPWWIHGYIHTDIT